MDPRDRAGSTEPRMVLIFFLGVVAVLVGGTVGYMLLEGWSLIDAVYMTVIGMTSVGFEEVHPLSTAGQVFTVVLLISGVAVIAYGLRAMIEFLVSGTLTGMFRRRAVRKRICNLSGHYILCGFGRVGEAVAQEFRDNGADFVVIDDDPEVVERLDELDYLAVVGDATQDDILREACIEHARGLVAAVDSDADNLYVVLSARVLNPGLTIVVRASSDESVSKLRRAGADQVLSPYRIGGKKMATLMLKPLVSDYLEVVTGGGEIAFRVEEFSLNHTCEVVGRSIKELDIRNRTGATVLAVRRGRTGELDTNPAPDVVLEEDDVLIAIATAEDIGKLEELFACRIPPTGAGRRAGGSRSSEAAQAPPG